MEAMDEITERMDGFKSSGLIAAYEVIIVDDSVRLRLVAGRDQEPGEVRSFVAEALSGLLSQAQINVEKNPG
jgi:hypothetical protein